jgi:hypothetical protein
LFCIQKTPLLQSFQACNRQSLFPLCMR